MANKPNNPSLWSRAKSLARQKFDVYPSAYANGWAAKWYKGKGGTWRKAEYGMEVMEDGGVPDNEGFNALPERVQQMIISRMEQGGEKMPPEIARARFAAAGNMDQMADYGYAYGGMTYPFMADGGEPNGSMALGQMAAVQDKMNKLLQFVKPDDNLDPWIASKLAVMDHSADAIADYMMYNPEVQQEDQMMANGGYVVSRSNDRKGKTHKVTGPDGTVKYFGDSKLGQHPKDPERKKAFYARHKKNLAGNPYFRAFARKTWEEGGEIDMMAEGGSTFSGNAWYGDGGYIPDLGMVIEGLSKYQMKGQVDENNAWIRKMMEFEATQGSATGGGLSNWGYNSRDPKSLDEAVGFFKQDFLPKVQQYPMGMRERMGDYMYNTGRNPNDLLLYNAGKISLDQLNSPNVFTNEWNQYGPDIQKMYSDPTFINKLDQSRDDVYRTTKQVNGQPNPAYDASWKDRARMFGPSMSSVAPIGTQKLAATSPVVNQAPKISAAKPVMQIPSLTDAPLLQLNTNRQPNYNWTNISQATASQEPQQMATKGNTPQQVNYNGKQQAYLSDMYGSGMMTFDNKQEMDLTGQGVNTYAWDSFGQDQNAPAKTAAMNKADKPFQIEQQQAVNPIYGDVEKLQGMLNVASRKDLKASVKDFNNTYDSNMKVPGSYMGANGQKTVRKINNFSDFLRKGIGTASAVTDVFNMRKGKREQEWRDRNLGSTSSLYPVVPENMSGNRGDYVVTGSRYGDFRPDEKTVNLGQYTGKFYPQLNMQLGGGIIDEQLSLPEELMQDPNMSLPMPEESAGAYENNATPVNFNLTKDYKEYADIANNFIKQVNPDTDITGEMLAYGAQMAEKKYGKTVPVELALAQLQQEGYLAKTKKPNRPQRTRNPFNVGNTDDGSNIPHNDLQSGIDSYYKLMATSYLSTRTPEQLLQNFVNKNGNRYATADNYESSLRNIIAKINKTRQTKFEDGGYVEGDLYELSEDQIRSILSAGGNVEFV